MPLNSTLVHPQLFKSMPQFFPSLCSIYEESNEVNPLGERIQIPTDAFLAGSQQPLFEDIPCAIGDSTKIQRKGLSEERTADATFTDVLLVVMLAGNFPSIVEKMRAVVDGVVYNIRDVSLSPVISHTELIVEVITIL